MRLHIKSTPPSRRESGPPQARLNWIVSGFIDANYHQLHHLSSPTLSAGKEGLPKVVLESSKSRIEQERQDPHKKYDTAMKKPLRKHEPYRVTAREFQRSLFLANLRSQLDKVADAHIQVLSAARDYVQQGLSEPEVRELLQIDGFDCELIGACMQRLASEPEAYREQWGFELEDAYGRIVSHDDLKISLEASSEADAMAKVEQLVVEGEADRVIRVFRIG